MIKIVYQITQKTNKLQNKILSLKKVNNLRLKLKMLMTKSYHYKKLMFKFQTWHNILGLLKLKRMKKPGQKLFHLTTI